VTRKTTRLRRGWQVRLPSLILALGLSAACGVKPSAMHDTAAERARRAPQDLPSGFNGGLGDVDTNAGGNTNANPSAEKATSPTTAPTAVEGRPPAGAGEAVVAAGPPATIGSRPVTATSGPAAGGTARAAASETPTTRSGPVYGPPAPSPSPAPAPPPGATEPPPAPTPPRGGFDGGAPDRTGVTDTTIKIGIHAPVTGAAPFPQKAFEASNDLYWKYLKDKGGVNGRNVQVVFRDDKYNPTDAVQACREMVEQEHVFLIIGFAGTDQISACARYAESVGVPYFSGGTTEDGLSGLNRYFAISQSYDQQSSTLVKLMKNRIRKTKVAVVVIASPALNNTVKSITNEINKAGGLQIVRSSRIGKYASDAELLSEAQQLKTSGAEIVYVIAAPIPFIKLATNAQAQAYHPVWVGPGTTNGFQVVAEAGCPSIDSAKFLSPFPQLDAIDELDPNYKVAFRKYVGNNPDDIGILNWGMNKTIHQMLEATGPDLSRQSFLKTVTSGRTFHSNVYPDVTYSDTIRFGAHAAHLLEADCTSRSWRTTGRFVADF
jgi:ABC-type branched-subunit amino acid transport system substrate-binding protein